MPESLKPIDGFWTLLDDIQGGYEQIVALKGLKNYLESYEREYEIIYY